MSRNRFKLPFQTIVLWKNRFPWSRKLSYRLRVLHRPLIGAMRVYLSSGKTLLLDSGNIYDGRLTGGRFGPFCFSQGKVMWANLQYKCNGLLMLVDVRVDLSITEVGCKMDMSINMNIAMWTQQNVKHVTVGVRVFPLLLWLFYIMDKLCREETEIHTFTELKDIGYSIKKTRSTNV